MEDKRETRTFTLQLQSGRHVIFVHARSSTPSSPLVAPCTLNTSEEERKGGPGSPVGKKSESVVGRSEKAESETKRRK